MSQLDDIDEQQWHARVARKRLDLSTSVEETLAENSFQEDEWLDELDGGDEIDSSKHESQFDIQAGMGSKKNLALIPPRLSLQSRSLPVVHADTPVESHKSSSHLAVRTPCSEPRSGSSAVYIIASWRRFYCTSERSRREGDLVQLCCHAGRALLELPFNFELQAGKKSRHIFISLAGQLTPRLSGHALG